MADDEGHVLYLHGRGDRPARPPGDLVVDLEWPVPLRTPIMDARWDARPFGVRVGQVTVWLEDSRLAIGHSFGGWLLLCACIGRLERGRETPPILLLSSVLGSGRIAKSSGAQAFAQPPRMRAVQRALGLAPGGSALFPGGSLELIHALDDDHCPVAPVRTLSERYRVTLVRGGHRLDSGPARTAVSEALERYRAALAESRAALEESRDAYAPRRARSSRERAWPRSVDEAVERLLVGLSPQWKETLRGTSRDRAQRRNLTLGLAIRNAFGLWRGNRALLADCARLCGGLPSSEPEAAGRIDADAASAVILGVAWDRLRESADADGKVP